jgi:hypothetical protein
MKAQYSFLNQIKNDLKKYQKVAKQSTNSIDENLSKIPDVDKEFFVNLQNKINTSIKDGDIAKAMDARNELLNYLKQQNGTSDSSNKS